MSNFFVRVPDYAQEPDQDGVQPERAVLKPIWRIFFALLLGIGVLALWPFAAAVGDWAWQHWAWPVMLGAGAVAGSLASTYVDSSRMETTIWLLITSGAILAACWIDGVQPIRAALKHRVLERPTWHWIVFVVLVATVALTLRLLPQWWSQVTIYDLVKSARAILPLALLGLWIAYLLLRLAVSITVDIGLGNIRVWAGENWPPLASLGFVLAVAIRVRSLMMSQAMGDFADDEYPQSPRYESEDEDLRFGSRGAFVRRVAYVMKRAGLGAADLTLVAVASGLIAYTLLYWVPEVLVTSSGLNPAELAKARTDERRTILALFAAIGAGATLVYTHLRHQIERDASVSARFNEAVRQLASDDTSTKLGGIYSLGQVARQSPSEAGNAVEVLSAFTREESVRGTPIGTEPLSQVVAASLKVLAVTPRWSSVPDLSDCNFTSAPIMGLRLRAGTVLDRAKFDDSEIEWLVMDDVDAEGVSFEDARLEQVSANRARLAESSFNRINMTGCSFAGADLSDATFLDAEITRVDFRGSILHGCNFQRAVIRRCDFSEVLSFTGVDLRGCDLSDSSCSPDWEIWDAQYDQDTRWPSGFQTENLRSSTDLGG